MRGVYRPLLSLNVSVARSLLSLYDSVAKTWRFRSWIETEPSFSNNLLDCDCFSLYGTFLGTFRQAGLFSYYFYD